jgi:RNA polymerase sporulation-specific sigma factor
MLVTYQKRKAKMTRKGGSVMVQGKVEICGVNTAKLPLLKNAEKEELFKKIEEGDQDARMAYINGNLRLVLSVIKRFHSSSENVDDLFQIGCVGLIKAIDNFDSSLNVKFSTYAVPMIVPCRKIIY